MTEEQGYIRNAEDGTEKSAERTTKPERKSFIYRLIIFSGLIFFGLLSFFYLLSLIWMKQIIQVINVYDTSGIRAPSTFKTALISGFLFHIMGFTGFVLLKKRIKKGFYFLLFAVSFMFIFYLLNSHWTIINPFVYLLFLIPAGLFHPRFS